MRKSKSRTNSYNISIKIHPPHVRTNNVEKSFYITLGLFYYMVLDGIRSGGLGLFSGFCSIIELGLFFLRQLMINYASGRSIDLIVLIWIIWVNNKLSYHVNIVKYGS